MATWNKKNNESEKKEKNMNEESKQEEGLNIIKQEELEMIKVEFVIRQDLQYDGLF